MDSTANYDSRADILFSLACVCLFASWRRNGCSYLSWNYETGSATVLESRRDKLAQIYPKFTTLRQKYRGLFRRTCLCLNVIRQVAVASIECIKARL